MKDQLQKLRKWLGFESVNLRRLFAQAVVLSLTIYTPFFLQSWKEDSKEAELNEMYKTMLMEDLYYDLDNLGIVKAQLQVYIDSATSIVTTPAVDSSAVQRRVNATIILGISPDFQPNTNIDAYSNQLRDHGDLGDLKLLHRLEQLKAGFALMNMIESRRMDFTAEHFTEIFIHHLSFTKPGLTKDSFEYFTSDEYFNTVLLFLQLAEQTKIFANGVEGHIKLALQACGEDIVNEPMEPENLTPGQ